MVRFAEHVKTVFNLPVVYLKMLFREDFFKLLFVCLKMLFRKSTRKRFVFLVITFLIMMGFNTYSYVMKFHKTENQKKEILDENAFKVFFLRFRTNNNFTRFLVHHHGNLQNLGSELVKKAFIYQNNLYIHFFPPSKKNKGNTKDHPKDQGTGAMHLLYALFNIEEFAEKFYVDEDESKYNIKVTNAYVDHNGTMLSDDILASRHKSLKYDLLDIADMIRERVRDKRITAFNSLKKRIIDNLQRVPLDKNYEPNPFLSRVESIIPMNFLHILTNISNDNTTDIMDLSESVTYGKDLTIETFKEYLRIPAVNRDKVMYRDMDIYPRYIPLFISDLLTPQWNLLLYQNINIKTDFMSYIDQLHFKGHYLFSYEKSHIIKDKVRKINDDIHSNHINFYLTDLSMGIAFPFMISLFAFIHLKTEVSFLCMFKNKIRELLFIFWLLPVFLMLLVKGGVLSVYLLYLLFGGFSLTAYLALPLLLSFSAASMAFYPINKWCFSQFTGDTLNLYALHKGR